MSIYIGTENISKMNIGDNPVSKMYVGSQLVYSLGTTKTWTDFDAYNGISEVQTGTWNDFDISTKIISK